jgi:glycogen debranching enzyme
MNVKQVARVEEAKKAALEVLLHNSRGPYRSLPRTAGWGYPEPYTRDLMICGMGILASGNQKLIKSLRRVLQTLENSQSRLGHMPGLVHDPYDRGSSDTTPLFILILGIFRNVTGETEFLEEALRKAMTWMEYQSASDQVIVQQLPTSDWRDEQWILGHGLYVNAILYSYLRLFGEHERADHLEHEMDKFTIQGEVQHRHVHEGLALPHKPYFAAWSYKVYSDERFDLLGNSLAILSGLASPSRAKAMVTWIERESEALRNQGLLALDLPPNYFPYMQPGDPDWRRRYQRFNLPGEYHNGGVWPFVCGFYVAAIVAAGRFRLAEKKLMALTELVRPAREADVEFGFNEWFKAQDGTPRGVDWQSWSAAMYLYAAISVEERRALFFDQI